MKTIAYVLSVSFACVTLLPPASAPAADATPLPHAHAHNDYLHPRPLLDALEQGFCSVEADIWLVNGQLLVAHDLKDVHPERTLQKLYLDPLLARTKQNNGHVFRDEPAFTLLIDIKSESTNTYIALRKVLESYATMLTRFQPAKIETNAVTVVISGNRPRGLMAAETRRLAAYDGRLVDLESAASRDLIPLISDNWTLHFKWRAKTEEGPLSEMERTKLKVLVARAHQQGRRIRFWGAPDQPAMWRELRDAGVDYLNTDRLADMRSFLKAAESQAPKSQ
jgi:hypothetical protein